MSRKGKRQAAAEARELKAHKGRSCSHNRARQRKAIAARDGHGCCFCGGLMDWTVIHPGMQPSPDAVTIEHVIPRSQGGGNSLDNLKLAHRRCNMAAAGKVDGAVR